MKNKIFAILLMGLILPGCSTTYQKMGLGGGYDEMRLSKNSYLVEYNSNAFTDQSTNSKHALRRAAELTKQNGYKYFKIVRVSDTTSQYTTPVVATTTANANSFSSGTYNYYGYGHGTYNGSGNAYGTSSTIVSGGDTFTRPGVAIVITMLRNKTKDAYDANIILSNFKKDK